MNESWKSFWVGSIAAIVIAIVAGVVLQSIDTTTEQLYSTASTRL